MLAAGPDERRELLESYLRTEIARVLQVEPARLDVDQPLNEVGLDSLMVLDIRKRIERSLLVPLPVVSLAEGATIADLARGLGELVAETAAPARG